jgi:hypothetical protein
MHSKYSVDLIEINQIDVLMGVRPLGSRPVTTMTARMAIAAMCVFATMPMGALAKAKPNIVLFLCDDMDYTLGAWTPMKQTTQAFAEKVRLHA